MPKEGDIKETEEMARGQGNPEEEGYSTPETTTKQETTEGRKRDTSKGKKTLKRDNREIEETTRRWRNTEEGRNRPGGVGEPETAERGKRDGRETSRKGMRMPRDKRTPKERKAEGPAKRWRAEEERREQTGEARRMGG